MLLFSTGLKNKNFDKTKTNIKQASTVFSYIQAKSYYP